MNIRNRDTVRLAKELANLTGESMAEAVAEALRERLARVRQEKGIRLSDVLMGISRYAAPRWKEPYRSIDHAEVLYGDDGLPR